MLAVGSREWVVEKLPVTGFKFQVVEGFKLLGVFVNFGRTDCLLPTANCLLLVRSRNFVLEIPIRT